MDAEPLLCINKDHMIQVYRAKDSESQVCVAQKEVGLLRRTVKQLRQQLTQVQELLANRELEHRWVCGVC